MGNNGINMSLGLIIGIVALEPHRIEWEISAQEFRHRRFRTKENSGEYK